MSDEIFDPAALQAQLHTLTGAPSGQPPQPTPAAPTQNQNQASAYNQQPPQLNPQYPPSGYAPTGGGYNNAPPPPQTNAAPPQFPAQNQPPQYNQPPQNNYGGNYGNGSYGPRQGGGWGGNRGGQGNRPPQHAKLWLFRKRNGQMGKKWTITDEGVQFILANISLLSSQKLGLSVVEYDRSIEYFQSTGQNPQGKSAGSGTFTLKPKQSQGQGGGYGGGGGYANPPQYPNQGPPQGPQQYGQQPQNGYGYSNPVPQEYEE